MYFLTVELSKLFFYGTSVNILKNVLFILEWDKYVDQMIVEQYTVYYESTHILIIYLHNFIFKSKIRF